MAPKTTAPSCTQPGASRSLTNLVELLEAMREAGWVSLATPSLGRQDADTAETPAPATDARRRIQ